MAKRRLIRRQSTASKLLALPFDIWLSASEYIELLEWDRYIYDGALPAGAASNVLFMICRWYWNRQYGSYDDLFSYGDLYVGDVLNVPTHRPVLSVFVSFLTLALTTICICNAVYCYSRRKNYILLGRPLDNAPDTPSAHKVRYADASDQPSSPWRNLVDPLLSFNKETQDTGEEIWELSIWNPPIFNTYFATAYSPLHLLLIWYSDLGIMRLLFFLTLLSVYLFGLTLMFLTLSKDKTIIHGEVLSEYSKKVVKPIVAVTRRDVAVGTDGGVDVYSPSTNPAFNKIDIRESRSRVSMSPTTASPWSPYKASSSNMASSSSSQDSPLRHRASLNALGSFHIKLPPGEDMNRRRTYSPSPLGKQYP